MRSAARAVGGLRQDLAFIPEEEHLSVDPEVGVFGEATVNMDFFKGDKSKFRNIFQKNCFPYGISMRPALWPFIGSSLVLEGTSLQ